MFPKKGDLIRLKKQKTPSGAKLAGYICCIKSCSERSLRLTVSNREHRRGEQPDAAYAAFAISS